MYILPKLLSFGNLMPKQNKRKLFLSNFCNNGNQTTEPLAILLKKDILNQKYLLTTKVYKNNVCVATMANLLIFKSTK